MKNLFYLFLFIIITVYPSLSQTDIKPSEYTLTPPAILTAEQDHSRLMKLLGIDSLRPGPSGNPNAPNAYNSDESKANPYPELPDPLTLNVVEIATSGN